MKAWGLRCSVSSALEELQRCGLRLPGHQSTMASRMVSLFRRRITISEAVISSGCGLGRSMEVGRLGFFMTGDRQGHLPLLQLQNSQAKRKRRGLFALWSLVNLACLAVFPHSALYHQRSFPSSHRPPSHWPTALSQPSILTGISSW